MKALVTGATGFLGQHLVEALLKRGLQVRAMAHSQSTESIAHPDLEWFKADLTQTQNLSKAVRGVQVIYHVAGAMSMLAQDRRWLFDVNVRGTENILRAASQEKVEKFVHVSSAVAVGASRELEVLTEASPNTVRAYNFANYESKYQGEALALKAQRESGLNVTVVNPSLIYGAGDAVKKMRRGSVMAARGKQKFYSSGHVNVVSVESVVQALLSVPQKGKNGERYLLTGDNLSIQEMFKIIARCAGVPAPRKLLRLEKLEPLARVADFLKLPGPLNRENIFAATACHWYDNAKAKSELDFTPGPAEEALKNSVKWMKQNHYLE